MKILCLLPFWGISGWHFFLSGFVMQQWYNTCTEKKQATLTLAHSFKFSYGSQIKGEGDIVTVIQSMFRVRPGEQLFHSLAKKKNEYVNEHAYDH